MKAIFDVACAAGATPRRPRGDAGCDCALRPRTAKSATPTSATRGNDCPVPPSATPGSLSGFLDERLDEGLELPVRDGIARARWARRSGDGHGCLPDSVALVLLASCSMSRWTSDPTDLYEQVAGEIRRAIAEGGGEAGGASAAGQGSRRRPGGQHEHRAALVTGAPGRGSARVPARAWRLGRGDPRARGRCPESQGAGRLRPTAGLPRGRAGRNHRGSRLRIAAVSYRRHHD